LKAPLLEYVVPTDSGALNGRALSPNFPAGELAFFILWRRWPHDGDVAAGGDMVLAIYTYAPSIGRVVVAGFFAGVLVWFVADSGARAIGETDAAAAVEVRGRRRRRPGSNAALRDPIASFENSRGN
jgi:hypothetical protein